MTFEEWFEERGYDRFYHYHACKEAWFASHRNAQTVEELQKRLQKVEQDLEICKNRITIPT